MVTLSSTKEARRYNGKKIASSTSGVGKIGQPHCFLLVIWLWFSVEAVKLRGSNRMSELKKT